MKKLIRTLFYEKHWGSEEYEICPPKIMLIMLALAISSTIGHITWLYQVHPYRIYHAQSTYWSRVKPTIDNKGGLHCLTHEGLIYIPDNYTVVDATTK